MTERGDGGGGGGERLRVRNRGEREMGEERERESYKTPPTHTDLNNKIRQSHYRFQEALIITSTPTPSLAFRHSSCN